MRKKVTIFALCLAAICVMGATFAIANARSFDYDLFLFNSSRHTVHDSPMSASMLISASFGEFHDTNLNFPDSAIIIGEVAGPSINRIIFQPVLQRDSSVPSGLNHVITPILVHYIIHMDEGFTSVQVGEIVNVIEGYFYVTPETGGHERGLAPGTIVTHFSTWPMETGNRYLIYLFEDLNFSEVYRYNGEAIPFAFFRESIYLLNPTNSRMARLDNPSRPHYAQWWQDAMDMHGHLADEVPWPEHPESIINQLNFNLGSEPTNPSTISPIDVNAGFRLLNFIETRHDNYPEGGPTRPGYDFVGWYLDDGFTMPVTEDFRMPARDVTLYARWQ